MRIEVLQSEFSNSEIIIHNPAKCVDEIWDWHIHDAYEFIMVIEGNEIVYTSENEYYVEAGDIILINSRVPHKTKAYKTTSVFLLQTELNFTAESEFNYLLRHLSSSDNSAYIFKAGSGLNYDIAECFERIINENTSRKASYDLFIKSAVLNIFAILYRNNIIKNPQEYFNTKYIKRIIPALNYINENYSEDISLTYISKLLNVDKSHFCRIFKQAVNTSFIQYVNSVRIYNAAKLLRSTDKTISEISTDTGFSSPSYFTKEFKLYMGCSPNHYKKIKLSN